MGLPNFWTTSSLIVSYFYPLKAIGGGFLQFSSQTKNPQEKEKLAFSDWTVALKRFISAKDPHFLRLGVSAFCSKVQQFYCFFEKMEKVRVEIGIKISSKTCSLKRSYVFCPFSSAFGIKVCKRCYII